MRLRGTLMMGWEMMGMGMMGTLGVGRVRSIDLID
jgi:hypothetical protein